MANQTRQIDVGQVVQDLIDAQAAYEKALEDRARARELVRMFEKYLSAEERKQVADLIKKTDRGKGSSKGTTKAA